MNARDDKALASPSPKRPKSAQAGQGAGAPAPLFGTSTRTPARSLAPVSAARKRKLHVGHFAFMRSVVQGLDPRESWERYFRVEGEATDQRTVRATIAWIRDEFAAAAKREDRFGPARLVRIDATRIADPSPASPASTLSPKRAASKTSARPTRSLPTKPSTAGRRNACAGAPA